MPASPSCSSKRSPPRKPASPRPKRRGWPNRSGHGLPPRARRRRSRPRPRRTPKRRAGPHCGRKGQAGRAGAGGCGRTEARRRRNAATDKGCRQDRRRRLATGRLRPPAPPEKGEAELAALSAGPRRPTSPNRCRPSCAASAASPAAADGDWNATSQRSLTLFNRYAGTKLDTKLASTDALDTIKLKPSRVCPLVCEHGFKADGDRCSKIVCAEGSFLNDDNECEKRRAKSRSPSAMRRAAGSCGSLNGRRERRSVAKPQASGQIVCDRGGCRPVERGCHLEFRTTAQGGPTRAAAVTC
jgi:hypothetical protein